MNISQQKLSNLLRNVSENHRLRGVEVTTTDECVERKSTGEEFDMCLDGRCNITADLLHEHDEGGVHTFKPAYSSSDEIFNANQMVTKTNKIKIWESTFFDTHPGNCDRNVRNTSTYEKCRVTESLILDRSQQLNLLHSVLEMMKLIIILGYFVLCDKLDFFMTAKKTFSQSQFWAGLISLLTASLLLSVYRTARKYYTENVVHLPTNDAPVAAHKNARTVVKNHSGGLLSKEMTLEWRGWMQAVILVYHVTGASQSLPIYMHVRVLVSAYLFLSGYGHFTRAWTSCRPEGVWRYTQVMFRLNFWTVLLCLVMQRPYQFYYFVPLVSFWYSVLYLLLILPPRFTVLKEKGSQRPAGDYGRAAVKLMILAGLVTGLECYEDIFKTAFSLPIWRWMFNLADDGLREWRFRWTLDRFSMLYGSIFALVHHAWLNFSPKNSKKCCWFRMFRIVLFVVSMGGLGSYVFLIHHCESKEECNFIHPYLTWIPITAYILFRHQLSSLGLRPSTMFQWLGRISLELFVCQYHILLAAGTRALLVLVPFSPAANTLVTVLVFLCVSHQVHLSTEALLCGLVHRHWGKFAKRFVIIVLLGACCCVSGITYE